MCFVNKEAVHAKLLKGHGAVLPAGVVELFQTGFQGTLCALQLLDAESLSSPVIKCKKTPRKKCSFVAEVKGKR